MNPALIFALVSIVLFIVYFESEYSKVFAKVAIYIGIAALGSCIYGVWYIFQLNENLVVKGVWIVSVVILGMISLLSFIISIVYCMDKKKCTKEK